LGRRILRQGETLRQFEVNKKQKERIKELQNRLNSYSTKPKESNLPIEFNCRACCEIKPTLKFKSIETNLTYGICISCSNEDRIKTRRMQETVTAASKANDIMTEATKKVEMLFERHKLPLEARLLSSIVHGSIEIVNILQTGVRHSQIDPEGEPVILSSDAMNKEIVWPMVAYAYTISGFNQVLTARILGISRNTLRSRMLDIQEFCPRLIREYRAEGKWIKEYDSKMLGYLEQNPNEEITYEEEITGGVDVIDSGIDD